eukprot:COSAG01_NODE_35667_length_528_cov_1.685315_1_plen_102_part_10
MMMSMTGDKHLLELLKRRCVHLAFSLIREEVVAATAQQPSRQPRTDGGNERGYKRGGEGVRHRTWPPRTSTAPGQRAVPQRAWARARAPYARRPAADKGARF